MDGNAFYFLGELDLIVCIWYLGCCGSRLWEKPRSGVQLEVQLGVQWVLLFWIVIQIADGLGYFFAQDGA